MVRSALTITRTGIANSNNTTAGGTSYAYIGMGGMSTLSGAEVNRQITYRTAGTISRLYVMALNNTTTASSTVTVRKNGADTLMTVTIPAGTNTTIEDSIHSETIASGDRLSAKIVSGGTGTFRLAICSVIFNATNNCVVKIVSQAFNLTSASSVVFVPVTGYSATLTTTESDVQHTIKKPGTAKNAYIYVSANARTTDTTFILRKNQTDTAISITYAAGQGGVKEDTSNSIPFAVDDEMDWKIVTGAGTQTLTVQAYAIEYETTTNNGFITAGAQGTGADFTLTPSLTRYNPVGGGLVGSVAESDSQITARAAFSLSNLTVYVKSNTITANTTVRLRKNGANANQVITIDSGATGYFVDTTNTDTFTESDTLDYQIISGGTGTNITIGQLALWSLDTEVPVVGVVGGSFRAQGRSPLYRTVKPKAVAVIIRLKIQLQYQVTKLTMKVGIAYINQRPKPAIKYASAIITPVLNILPLRQRPTPKPVIRTITTQIPYGVQSIQLKSACAYEVDKLITRKQQTKLRTIATNFLFSDV